MADEAEVVWMYTPSFALAVFGSILYGLVFLHTFYLTVIKYRSWFFLCVLVGAGVEVAGYALRCYSIKAPTEVVTTTPLPPPPSQRLTPTGPLRSDPLPHRPRARPHRRGQLPPHRSPHPGRAPALHGPQSLRRTGAAAHARICVERRPHLLRAGSGVGRGVVGRVGGSDGQRGRQDPDWRAGAAGCHVHLLPVHLFALRLPRQAQGAGSG